MRNMIATTLMTAGMCAIFAGFAVATFYWFTEVAHYHLVERDNPWPYIIPIAILFVLVGSVIYTKGDSAH